MTTGEIEAGNQDDSLPTGIERRILDDDRRRSVEFLRDFPPPPAEEDPETPE